MVEQRPSLSGGWCYRSSAWLCQHGVKTKACSFPSVVHPNDDGTQGFIQKGALVVTANRNVPTTTSAANGSRTVEIPLSSPTNTTHIALRFRQDDGWVFLGEVAFDVPVASYTYRDQEPRADINPTYGDGPNIALASRGAVAFQSTTAANGAVAGRAIDGNRNGSFGGGSVTHTANSSPSWWTVDLGSVQPIGSMILWNRTDSCCRDRLSNFRVSIRNTQNGADIWSVDRHTGATHVDTFETVTPPSGTMGRWVRIELLGRNNDNNFILSLAEVEVYGGSQKLTDGVAPTSPFASDEWVGYIEGTGGQTAPDDRSPQPRIDFALQNPGRVTQVTITYNDLQASGISAPDLIEIHYITDINTPLRFPDRSFAPGSSIVNAKTTVGFWMRRKPDNTILGGPTSGRGTLAAWAASIFGGGRRAFPIEENSVEFVPNDDQWHYYTFYFTPGVNLTSGGEVTGSVNLLRDGQFVRGSGVSFYDFLSIGALSFPTANPLTKGPSVANLVIDDVNIWDRDNSSSEILDLQEQIYLRGAVATIDPNHPDLVQYYDCDTTANSPDYFVDDVLRNTNATGDRRRYTYVRATPELVPVPEKPIGFVMVTVETPFGAEKVTPKVSQNGNVAFQ